MNFIKLSLFCATHLCLSFLVESTILLDTSAALPALNVAFSTSALTSPTLATSAAFAGIGALALAGKLAAVQLIDIRRKRRMADMCLPISNPDIFFALAANSDHLGCGMRLICELEKTSDNKLSKEERLILGLFGRSPTPINKDELSTAKSGFQYAAFVGANAEDISECKKVFNQCPFDRITMMKAFQKLNKQQ